MDKKFAIVAAIAVMGVAVTGFSISTKMLLDPAKANSPPVAAPEFVCYDDGKLTERHVGIARAHPISGWEWRLRYVDQSGYFYYIQQRGEVCGVEK